MNFVPLSYVAFGCIFTGCMKAPAKVLPAASHASPTVAQIAAEYRSYSKITPEPVFVNPELAMSCIGARQDQVEAAMKTQGPHAHSAILVYLNDAAAKSFERKKRRYEVGAVVIKQKTLLGFRERGTGKWAGRTDNGVGGMVKRPAGYDPANGDWEYFYFEEPSKIESGRMASCIDCHRGAKDNDYVFGTWDSRQRANKAPEPTTTSVTPPAAQEPRQP